MEDKERLAGLLNTYREQIREKSPKSLAMWQKNRTVMPAGVGSLFRLADPFPMVIKRARGARMVAQSQPTGNSYQSCAGSPARSGPS